MAIDGFNILHYSVIVIHDYYFFKNPTICPLVVWQGENAKKTTAEEEMHTKFNLATLLLIQMPLHSRWQWTGNVESSPCGCSLYPRNKNLEWGKLRDSHPQSTNFSLPLQPPMASWNAALWGIFWASARKGKQVMLHSRKSSAHGNALVDPNPCFPISKPKFRKWEHPAGSCPPLQFSGTLRSLHTIISMQYRGEKFFTTELLKRGT